ncbi:MAG: hypothetical protein QOC81_808 [Thermoanaerobaculia bacterium]|jgi:Dyp-type peroxidase family|nr:hypothetical protein [Thermoanaerobaculia bacterium]
MTDILQNPEPIHPDDAQYASLFAKLQGNILKGHGRKHAVLIFFRFDKPAETVRSELLRLLEHVTSAADQLRQSRQFKDFGIPGALFTNFFLTASGYSRLGFSKDQLRRAFPPAEAQSFTMGLKSITQLKINDSFADDWEKAYRDPIDAMLLLADNDSGFLHRQAREHIDKIEKFASIATVERGGALHDETGQGIEHFGFADGLSQPLFFDGEMPEGRNLWNPFAPLSLALVPDKAVPKEDDACGSYFVFCKLEQDVRRFMIREQEVADALELKGRDRERVGAMAVGRFRDGTPLVLSPVDGRPGKENNFNYSDDTDGAKCPLQAHIRKTNPRGGVTSMNADQRVIRIVRRGIPYGVRNRHSNTFSAIEDLPSEGVGLLFMCFQKSIEFGFNFIQMNWANVTAFPEKGTGLDPVMGQGTAPVQQWPNEYGKKEPHHDGTFGGFVKMKGGEYFFAPSIPFLRRLAPPDPPQPA